MENTKDKKSEVEELAEYGSTARMIKEVKRHTRKRFTAEEKVKIVLEGFRKKPLWRNSVVVKAFMRRSITLG